MERLIEGLNGATSEERLKALAELVAMDPSLALPNDGETTYVNNHIHTTYSFSPYSPTKAVYMAKKAGLSTAGIIDHDSISGAREFIEAGKLLNMPTTIGIECRVDMGQTHFNNCRLNNTDQKGIAYVAMHGIPHTYIDVIKDFLHPYLEKRILRNRKMVDQINTLFSEKLLDFDKDIIPLSEYKAGGSITERRLLYALSLKLIETYGKGAALIEFLDNECAITVSGNVLTYMEATDNPYYAYDLLGILKGHFVSQFYIEATDECPDVSEFIALAKEVGAIAAYAYLGDVVNSVTGDKKDATFEDAYLDDLFDILKNLGFDAITYMPSRNTPEQLKRVRSLCDHHNFFQISGEDINSPRQSFICEALENPIYSNLIKATWALIGHETEGTKSKDRAMFSPESIAMNPTLFDRINYFYILGKQ
jgi:predicted metal-dependent phosphoesterase TrpH